MQRSSHISPAARPPHASTQAPPAEPYVGLETHVTTPAILRALKWQACCLAILGFCTGASSIAPRITPHNKCDRAAGMLPGPSMGLRRQLKA